METKPFKTFREQIELLKSRGLTIRDENRAISILSTYSYYEIINGYEDRDYINQQIGGELIPIV